MFFDAQAVLFTFVVLSPSFRKVKTKNGAVLMCDFRVIVKCTADLGLGKGGTSGKYFQSNYLEFRGIGLGEKALGISANGAASRHEFTNLHHSISSAVALGILMIFSTVVN